MTPMPHPPLFTQSHPERLFFVSLDENVLKGKSFADVEEVKTKIKTKQKNSRSTKRHQNR